MLAGSITTNINALYALNSLNKYREHNKHTGTGAVVRTGDQ